MNTLSKPIVVAGLICIDITPEFEKGLSYDLQTCIQPGKLIRTRGVTVSAGGVVSNTGLALVKLGANVHLMYMVGKDLFGEMITNQLGSYHVPVTHLVTDDASTGYSLVLAVPGYDRIFMHDVGANDILTADHFDYDVIRGACIFHFGYPQSMKQFYIHEADTMIRMYQRVHDMGVATSLDMALADSTSESGSVNWKSVIKNVLPYVDFFEPSLEELIYSIDHENYEIWNKKAFSLGKAVPEIVPESYVVSLADQLIAWGGRVILIKCGSKGMYLQTSSQEKLDQIGGGLSENLKEWGGQKIWMPCFKADRVCSCTGAGDTSIAAFLYAIQRGFKIRRCVELAAATGATCVTSYDALSAIVSLDEINERIEAGWEVGA